MTTALLSLLPSLLPSIRVFTFPLLWTWRRIPMLFLLLGRTACLSLLTVTLVGDRRSVPRFAIELFFLFSNFGV